MKSEGIKFSIISNRISDYRLKPRDYAVYCCLVKHSNKNGVCFPSRRLIAEECCIDKKTVDTAIQSLEKEKAPQTGRIEHKQHLNGQVISVVYFFVQGGARNGIAELTGARI